MLSPHVNPTCKHNSMDPTREQALQFVTMINSGLPSNEAIKYFIDSDQLLNPNFVKHLHDKWMLSRHVSAAQKELMGNKTWMQLSLDEKIKWSLEKHYAEHAYFLYTHNYSELQATEKAKADTCRTVLENKLAGMSGKLNALDAFFQDVMSGVVELPNKPVNKPPLGTKKLPPKLIES